MTVDKSDPYPGLRRKALFADVAEKVVSSPKRMEEVPIMVASDRAEQAKEVLAVAEKEAEPLAAPKKRGRPPTGPKPWELEGISRATYKRREKAALRED